MRRVAGLDSIRFVCALIVVFYHKSNPFRVFSSAKDTHFGRILIELYSSGFNGQAAVITFFLISGFCIHYPYASGRRFTAMPFLLARLVRIGIPVVGYLILLRVTQRTENLTALLWSIYCEMIYYALYPVLRASFAKTSVLTILLLSYVAAALVTMVKLDSAMNFFSAGNLTWLVGLPCWLLGCHLAEQISRSKENEEPGALVVWSYRAGAAGLAFAAQYAMRNYGVAFLISLQIFALYAYLWIRCEIAWHRTKPANRLLEWFGGAAYSMYLTHLLTRFVWDDFFGKTKFWMWAGEIGCALLVGVVFYALVEMPSHSLARRISRRARENAGFIPADGPPNGG
ncbi:MAG: acyltransferase [Chthoniobacter sp.]|uniref:acyltransferase family protein n=1 Tax=Chthoniobacter sp. TaxID=2510640 RepID=UPI0032AC87F8